jgi:hypothetical protein
MSLDVKARSVEAVKVIYPVSTIPLEVDLAMARSGHAGTACTVRPSEPP